MLNSVVPPAGVDEARLRRRLLEEYGIEVGGGLGPLKGKIWRIGLMGESSRRENLLALLTALEEILPAGDRGTAVGAAQACYGDA
jgi:alanine-glyoxylate transaminase/serine-glyoxylate transaminase/serine-pyruvate transaminase